MRREKVWENKERESRGYNGLEIRKKWGVKYGMWGK